jgi:hypothetical protein
MTISNSTLIYSFAAASAAGTIGYFFLKKRNQNTLRDENNELEDQIKANAKDDIIAFTGITFTVSSAAIASSLYFVGGSNMDQLRQRATIPVYFISTVGVAFAPWIAAKSLEWYHGETKRDANAIEPSGDIGQWLSSVYLNKYTWIGSACFSSLSLCNILVNAVRLIFIFINNKIAHSYVFIFQN